jgi:hypothetical protein
VTDPRWVSWPSTFLDPLALAVTHSAALTTPVEIGADLLHAVGDEDVEDLGM